MLYNLEFNEKTRLTSVKFFFNSKTIFDLSSFILLSSVVRSNLDRHNYYLFSLHRKWTLSDRRTRATAAPSPLGPRIVFFFLILHAASSDVGSSPYPTTAGFSRHRTPRLFSATRLAVRPTIVTMTMTIALLKPYYARTLRSGDTRYVQRNNKRWSVQQHIINNKLNSNLQGRI